jgi:predicted dienelactone hydrolase
LSVTQQFIGNVGNDPNSSGVAWTLMQAGNACSTACGSVSPSTTTNGGASTYTAPGVLPANPTVVLKATSVTDPTKSVPATVTLTSGTVSLVPADLQFGGRSPPEVAVLTNTGSSKLTISSMTLGGTNPTFFAESNTCGTAVAAGVSCTITVTYKSINRSTHTAVLSIADNSPDSPQQLHLTGVGKHTATAALHAALRAQVVATVPRPTGSSQVGTRVMRLLDTFRDDPYLANGAKRELMVRFWYPASGNNSCTRAEYTSAGAWSEFAQLLGTTLPQVMTNSCLNVPVADGAHPVVVLSHGFTGTFTDYTFLTEDLASRGYVVASVDHTYEATAVEFPDGRLEKGVFGSHLTSYTRSDPQALAFAVSIRLDDLRFVLNELAALDGGRDRVFAGKLDLSRIALAGHSLGGLTAIRGVQQDVRFRAGISLDGVVPDRLALPTTTPVLLLTAGRSQWNENDCQLWSAFRGTRLAVNLNGAEHTALSDAVWLANGAVATGAMGIEKTVAAARDASAAFLDAVFKGSSMDAPAIRSLMNDPKAIVTTQDQSPCSPP